MDTPVLNYPVKLYMAFLKDQLKLSVSIVIIVITMQARETEQWISILDLSLIIVTESRISVTESLVITFGYDIASLS